jgi:hypothetical protein
MRLLCSPTGCALSTAGASHVWPTTPASGPGLPPAAALATIQESTLRREPSLLRAPAPALHASLAWLLPVHQEFDRSKDELWQRHGLKWMSVLTGVLGTTQSLRLCYRHLVATASAIIAVAR